jgi:hypothetical protein
MAALAIPIIVLGSIFILSEQEKKDSAKNSALQEVDNTRKLLAVQKVFLIMFMVIIGSRLAHHHQQIHTIAMHIIIVTIL